VLASPVAQCLDRGDYFGDYLGDTERVTVTVNIRKSQANHTYQNRAQNGTPLLYCGTPRVHSLQSCNRMRRHYDEFPRNTYYYVISVCSSDNPCSSIDDRAGLPLAAFDDHGISSPAALADCLQAVA
jgi:hypothetical protein